MLFKNVHYVFITWNIRGCSYEKNYLGGEIIPTRFRHNANFHQQKSSIHMSWKFPRLTEISPTADQILGQAGKYFLI